MTHESDTSATVQASRRPVRLVLQALAVVTIVYCLIVASALLLIFLGIPGPKGIVLLFSFPFLGLVMLFQYFSSRSVIVGWIVAATLCGALLGCMVPPSISDDGLKYLYAARHAFWGAVIWMVGGAFVCLVIGRVQLRICHLQYPMAPKPNGRSINALYCSILRAVGVQCDRFNLDGVRKDVDKAGPLVEIMA